MYSYAPYLVGCGMYLTFTLSMVPLNLNGAFSRCPCTAALRRIGYTGEEMSWHGFRAMASTLLNELGFPPDIIELQLAYQERNEVRAACNRAQRLDNRRKMMQAWADYLDGLRAGSNVVPFRRSA